MSSLKKNLAYQTAYEILVIFLPFITAPYIARVLGTENSGIYSFCNTMAVYFVTFGNLGIGAYGNRSIARVRDDKEERSRVFSELFIFHAITSGIAIIAYVIYYLFIATKYRDIVLIEGIYVVSVIVDVNWFFCGMEKFKLTVLRSAIIKIISVILIFCLVKTKNDLPVYTMIMTGAIFVNHVALLPMLKKYVSFRKIRVRNLGKHLFPMLLLFAAVIAAHLNRVIDKTMLGWFGFMDDLGCYDYADRIIRMPLGVISALGAVMLSKMSNLYSTGSKQIKKILDISSTTVLTASVAFGFGLAAVAPEFIKLYLGKDFSETAFLVIILAFSIPLVGWNNFVRTQILIPTQRDKIYSTAVILGAIVNIIINTVLIQLFSARGAAVATVISYFVITLYQTINAKDQLDMKRVFLFIPVIVIAGAVMYGIVRLVALLDVKYFIRLLIEILVGAIVYIGIMIVYFIKKDRYYLDLIFRRRS